MSALEERDQLAPPIRVSQAKDLPESQDVDPPHQQVGVPALNRGPDQGPAAQ